MICVCREEMKASACDRMQGAEPSMVGVLVEPPVLCEMRYADGTATVTKIQLLQLVVPEGIRSSILSLSLRLTLSPSRRRRSHDTAASASCHWQ